MWKDLNNWWKSNKFSTEGISVAISKSPCFGTVDHYSFDIIKKGFMKNMFGSEEGIIPSRHC